MEYRQLGNSGLHLSALSFGSWVTFSNQVDTQLAEKLMTLAYERGVNFFDNAEVYAQGDSEKIMGKVLKKLGWSRDSYCVSSKVFWGGSRPTQRGLSRKHITDACHAALQRLQVDYLDLYYCHRPDIRTPIEETVRAMDTLVQQGKILYWGTSEWSATQIMEAYAVAKQVGLTPPTMEQPQYNLFTRDRVEVEYLPVYAMGLGTTIWSPLASGILTGKYSKGVPKDSRVNVSGFEWLRNSFEGEEGKRKISLASQLEHLAKETGMSLAQMSIAWCLKNPHVSSVILGASKENQLSETLGALEKLPLMTPDLMAQIEHTLNNRPAAPPDFFAR